MKNQNLLFYEQKKINCIVNKKIFNSFIYLVSLIFVLSILSQRLIFSFLNSIPISYKKMFDFKL